MTTKRKALLRALCIILCAAMFSPFLDSCGRRRRVVSPSATRRDTTQGTSGNDSADTEDPAGEERDADHVIVIDPGHGFGDEGFTSAFTARTEAQIDLSFSRLLCEELTKRGYTVYLTHDGETFPTTKADNGDESYSDRERAAFADEKKAEYFISVHCNDYSQDDSVSGSRVYVSSAAKAGKSAVRLAGEELCSALGGTEMGGEQSSLIVTTQNNSYDITTLADGVSLLLMLGYMSNEEDVWKMIDPAWLGRAARRAADAVDAYFPAQ